MITDSPQYYSKQYLEEEMQSMARRQSVTTSKKTARSIIPILENAKSILTTTYKELARATKRKKELLPAGGWLLDNFYIIQEQIVQLKEDLPRSYYSKLPHLDKGEYIGFPRVYELVNKLADISDNIIDLENTTVAVRAYQSKITLNLGELWAIPIFVRLCLIERLDHKAHQLLNLRKVRNKVDEVMDDILQNESEEPGNLIRELLETVNIDGADEQYFTILAQRLQAAGLLTEIERNWFNFKFRKWNTTLEEQLRIEAQKTSRLHLSIQNAISTLREASETDWSDFVEDCSVVERILRLDPSGYYSDMDFQTRDRYRKIIEKLSSHSGHTEAEVAQDALSLAEKGGESKENENAKSKHIGYYLLDEGYKELIREVNYRMPLREKLQRYLGDHPSAYFGFILLHTLILLMIVLAITGFLQAAVWLMGVTLLVAFLPALELAVVSTNRLLSLWLPPRLLPKLQTMKNVPDEYRTIVVVPTLFTSRDNVIEQFEDLEIRSLANPNSGFQFIILSDYMDADQKELPSDRTIMEAAEEQLDILNKKYTSKYGKKFFLLHRERKWNASEQSWMGWERKRGKLESLNHLLIQPEAESPFINLSEDFRESIRHRPVQYVITLDADTQVPPGSAVDLVRSMAHPLNHPVINEEKGVVDSGYGIIQPRISIPPKSATKSWFAHIYSGNTGLDPYTTAVSDVYQDLFGEGIYTGKGIYHVRAFEQLLGNRLPENNILSHDLLESTYLRCGLATDIELFDDFPSTYLNYSKRNHRWIRGDWQIMKWLFTKVPAPDGKQANPINSISQWKIFDNLRRSLNPVFLLIFLLCGWTILPGHGIIWTLAVLGITAFPIYSSFTTELFARPVRVKWKLYLDKLRSNLKINTVQAVTTLLFLPHQAYVSLDAIIRTLWRMYASRKYLLEWTTASQIEGDYRHGLLGYFMKMWPNLLWAAISVIAVAYWNSQLLYLAIPFALAWVIAPAFASLTEIPYKRKRDEVLTPDHIHELRKYARRTWHYFERYLNEEHSWLPPDNFQEEPYIGTVGRTSPTNIGLGISSTYVAYEYGYITAGELLTRLEHSLNSMKKLERYAGHFYNWYSTRSGEVLDPKYISTVDSGNLAINLLFVKQAVKNIGMRPWPDPSFWMGLEDTCDVLAELSEQFIRVNTSNNLQERINDQINRIQERFPSEPIEDIQEWNKQLENILTPARDLSRIDFGPLVDHYIDVEFDELSDWFNRPFIQIQSQLNEIQDYLKHKHTKPDKEELFVYNAYPDFEKRVADIIDDCDTLVEKMDFSILYIPDRDLFSIGYNVDRAILDKGTYDLLASEARLASFLAIAKGDVPPKHWFKLSRRLTSIDHNEILLSWGGTMFEYLMPLLYLSHYDETLLSNTYEKAVDWQIKYGKSRDNPWGFSESGYGVMNIDLHYQYRAFGVPGLGLRRGLAEDYVVSPYATMLALMVQPQASILNLRRLKEEGGYGLNGFYEAIDYTISRATTQSEKHVVKMYMAHHQGMSLLALANVTHDHIIQRIFHDEPMIQSCELLLQERIPKGIPVKEPRPIDVELEPAEEKYRDHAVNHAGKDALFDSPPRTHILSNGSYSTVITHAGTGYSQFNALTLTRWRSERVKDAWGFFFYIRDLQSNKYWSSGFRPANKKADRYDSWFHPGKVQIARVDDWIETFMEVCVSPEDNIELRKLTLTNYSQKTRYLDITSYAEVVLNQQESDIAHPAFSNLFVQTDHIPEHQSLIAKRRPRSAKEQSHWLVHTLASEDVDSFSEPLQYETDRQKFIGRGRSLDNPLAMDKGQNLTASIGNVPDPIVSLRVPIELRPGEKKSITFGLGVTDSREKAYAMADHYDNPYSTERVFELASIYGRVELEHIGISGEQAHYFQKLAGSVIYGNEQLRAAEEILKRNRKTQRGLWAYGISGDLPILVYHIDDKTHIRFVQNLLKAHTFWRLRGLELDLVIINDHPPSYINELQDAINSLVHSSPEHHLLNKRGGIFILKGDDVPIEDQHLLETVAVVNLKGKLPKLDFSTHVQSISDDEKKMQTYRQIKLSELSSKGKVEEDENLLLYNGYGGFSKDGKEYVLNIPANEDRTHLVYPPSPWINVIANPEFGFITSERGSDYTWSINSRENRITPWSNDATIDPAGEALYIRDEDNHLFWSPSPGPTLGSLNYEIRHGFGYTRHLSKTLKLEQEVLKWVSLNEPVKLIRVRIRNNASESRTLSVYHYLEWVLGVYREQSSRYIITDFDDELSAVFARNRYNNEFANRVAFTCFFTEGESLSRSFTTDRAWFIGKNCGVTNPRALKVENELSGRFGAGFDPCSATKIQVKVEAEASLDVYFLIGETESYEKAKKLIDKYQNTAVFEDSFKEVEEFWSAKLSKIQISTPVEEFDILFNGWLQYQNIACRMWGRSGFYQSGGAYGFRDQLQDAASALYLDRELCRKQILLHAAHQFQEGDVLHWWHPPTSRGVRTKITDDLLWMPYVTAFYVNHTGDQDILEEKVSFLKAKLLDEEEHEVYLTPSYSGEKDTIYEHCCRAIDRSLTKGRHGLPLMGAGDWNDGMNSVGDEGKGESVWLGFFLYSILTEFIPICKKFEDEHRLNRYEEYKSVLKKNLNKEGWDGKWYLRAYYDDGTPLGSSQNDECQIDAIAQAWSVISGVAPKKKAIQALDSAGKQLVSLEDGLIRLLKPPFDQTEKNPGYIKGYIPGVRENGGQYTHAALWLVMAFAKMGFGKLSVELIRMLTPIQHSGSKEKVEKYRVEPYAVAADIYGEPPLTGMGGWTWYTGSAGWMYRVLLESILGLRIKNGNTIELDPCISSDWKAFTISYKPDEKGTIYHIHIYNPHGLEKGVLKGSVDGNEIKTSGKGFSFRFESDGNIHEVQIQMVESGKTPVDKNDQESENM